jgi:hypothetical protein
LPFASAWKFVLILIRHSEQTDRIIARNFVNVLGREVQARDVLLLKVQKLYQRRTRRRQEQANIRQCLDSMYGIGSKRCSRINPPSRSSAQ